MLHKMLGIRESISRTWCGVLHREVTWPVQGRYRCRTCGREYAVAWETAPAAAGTAPARAARGARTAACTV